MQKKIKNIFAYSICSVAGAGYFPKAPGTFASIIAASLYYLINPDWPGLFFGIIVTLILGLIFTGYVEQFSGKDPGLIVIDEVSGQWICFLFLPQNDLIIVITAFILFRIFDILKPMGINKLQEFKAGWGVMLDDVLAGIYTNIILQILILTGVFG